MWDAEFLELMPLVCSLKPLVGRGAYGEATYDDNNVVMPHCHVQLTGREFHSADGTTRLEEGMCILDGTYQVDTTWGLWIPQPGSGNRQVVIQSVDQDADEDGWHHTTLHFGAL
jgi:hypothetical protein